MCCFLFFLEEVNLNLKFGMFEFEFKKLNSNLECLNLNSKI